MLAYLKRKFGLEGRAMSFDDWLSRRLDGVPAASGVPVSVQSALGLSALWCGVKVISEAVGMMPLLLYRRTGDDDRARADVHPLYEILHDEPNPEMTRPVFFETLQANALLHGNAYAEVERNGDGSTRALWPIHPTRVTPKRDAAGVLYYAVKGLPGTDDVPIPAADMIHVPGLGPDGSVGWALMEYGRDTIGFALAAQRFGSAWFKNAGRPGGMLTVEGTLSDQARENLRRSWQKLHAGADAAGAVAVLEEGTKFEPFTPTNEQAQYKDLLQFFVYEVARLLNCQPSKMHSLERATWGNLETLNQDFLTTTLQPWLTKWECEIKRKAISRNQRSTLYCEFLTDVVIRINYQTRIEGLMKAIGRPWMTVNEGRRLENLPPIDGGDELAGPVSPTPNPKPNPTTSPAAADPPPPEGKP